MGNLQQRKEEAVANNQNKVFTDNKDSTIETLSAPNSGRLLKFQDTQAKISDNRNGVGVSTSYLTENAHK